MRATGVINAGVIVWSGVFGMESPGEVMKRPLVCECSQISRHERGARWCVKLGYGKVLIIADHSASRSQSSRPGADYHQPIRSDAGVLVHALLPRHRRASPPMVSRSSAAGVQRSAEGLLVRTSPISSPSTQLHLSTDKPLLVKLTDRNVGLLNYWTLAQLPNLVIASPILSVSFYGVYRFLLGNPIAPTQPTSVAAVSSWTLAPFYIVHLALTLLLTFSAHSQIALRLSVTDPVIWWTVASLAVRRDTGGARIARDAGGKAAVAVKGDRPTQGMLVLTGFGKVWVSWVVVYGAISIPLWAGHYPPA
jgi:phosphatidylinositol glycan class V